MKVKELIFLSVPLSLNGPNFVGFFEDEFKNPLSLEGGTWMKNEMSPTDDSNKTKFPLF